MGCVYVCVCMYRLLAAGGKQAGTTGSATPTSSQLSYLPRPFAEAMDRGWRYAGEQWDATRRAQPGSIRWRVYQLALQLMKRMEPSESFLMYVTNSSHMHTHRDVQHSVSL